MEELLFGTPEYTPYGCPDRIDVLEMGTVGYRMGDVGGHDDNCPVIRIMYVRTSRVRQGYGYGSLIDGAIYRAAISVGMGL